MQLTLQACPWSVRKSVQSGTDHNLHKPDHEAVARIFEFGLNWQNDIGLVSPICEQYIDKACSFFKSSCLRAVRVAPGNSKSCLAFSNLIFALAKENAARE